ncbi:hypothetical protein [Streptomyces sp. NPDC002550]
MAQHTLRSGCIAVAAACALAPETELDAELFMAVTVELGDVVLGPWIFP